MTVARMWVLHLLWLIPLVVFLLVVSGRRHRRALCAYADQALLPRLTHPETRGKSVLRGVLLTAALALMVFALAGPRWGERYQEVEQKGVDIVLCVDVSRSMLVQDVKPSRLERAKREVADLINVVEGDRVGLVAFAGKAFLQCPLTLDYQALDMFVSQIWPELIPVQGTDLGDAVQVAAAAFDKKAHTDKVVLLLTDGEDNEGRGLNAAKEAGAQGIRIFVFGIGDPDGGPVPAGEGGGFEKDGAGRMVLSKLDEKTLVEIARTTGGDYVRSVDGDLDLDRLYFEGIRDKTEAQTIKTGKIRVQEERFHLFLLAAYALTLLERLVHDKIFENRGL